MWGGQASAGGLRDTGGAYCAETSAPTTPCTVDATTACLLGDRFRATLRYRNGFDNSPADTDAIRKPVIGFANPSFEKVFFYIRQAACFNRLRPALAAAASGPRKAVRPGCARLRRRGPG